MMQTAWYKKAIVYQIYPNSFKDNNNDGWGDIDGILSKLDYLKELGITAIWFSPLYVSPDYDYGYDIANYYDIDPKFGTLDDFKKLLNECHKRDIRVIMDMAINHTSIEHPWFKEAIKDKNSPYRDYYIIRPGIRKGNKLLPPTNWSSTFTGGAWERIGDSDDFYLHLFCVEQADLNWENENVRKEAEKIFTYWLEMGVDGFRLDVFNMFSKVWPIRDAKRKLLGQGEEMFVDGPRIHEFLKELNKEVFSKYDCYTVGEPYHSSSLDAHKYVDEHEKELNTIFNFDHFDSDNIGNAKFFKKPFDLVSFKKAIFNTQIDHYGNGWNTLVLENHDNARSISRFGINEKKYHYEAATFLPTITFLGFGIPFIYMGEEFGMNNAPFKDIDDFKDPVSHFIHDLLRHYHVPKGYVMNCIRYGARDNCRVPMQWDDSVNGGFNDGHPTWQKMNFNIKEINLKKDLESDKSIFRYYQKVINLKKTNDTLIFGDIKVYDMDNKRIVCYTRTYNDETYLIFGNFSNNTVTYKLNDEISKYTNVEVLSNYDEHIKDNNKFTLRPYEVLVYKNK